MLTPEVIAGLDPGIRQLVIDLDAAGFEPYDSGDGVTKFHNDYCDAGDRWQILPYPHVHLRQVYTVQEAAPIITRLTDWKGTQPDLADWQIDLIRLRPERCAFIVTLFGPIVPESEAIVREEWPANAPPYDAEEG